MVIGMKKILAAVVMMAALCSCKAKTCTILGTVEDPALEDAVVKLLDNPKAAKALDECVVKDGAFTLKCPIDPTKILAVVVGEEIPPVVLVPDVKKISVKVSADPVVEGSPLSTELQAAQKKIMGMFTQYNSRAMEMLNGGDSEGASAHMEEMYGELKTYCLEQYEKHTEDVVGTQFLSLVMQELEREEFNRLYTKGGKVIKEDAMIKKYYESINDVLLTLAADGSIKREMGSFDDIVGHGKYVLVDFWASWCAPCRREIPNVVEVYKQYKDKGLVVIGVAMNDEEGKIKAAMKDMRLPYTQILDPYSKIAGTFGISTIPHIILFSPEGEIVRRGMRGSDIEEAVKSVL